MSMLKLGLSAVPAVTLARRGLRPLSTAEAQAAGPARLQVAASKWSSVPWEKLRRVKERTVPEMVSNLHKLTRGTATPSKPTALHRLLNRVGDEDGEANFDYALRGYRIALHNGVKLDRSTAGLLVRAGLRSGRVAEVAALLKEPAKSRLFVGKSTLDILAAFARARGDAEVLEAAEAAAAASSVRIEADAALARAYVSAHLAVGDLAGALRLYSAAREACAGWKAALSSVAGAKKGEATELAITLAQLLGAVAEGSLPAVEGQYPAGIALAGVEEAAEGIASACRDARSVAAVQASAGAAAGALADLASKVEAKK